MNTTKRFSFNIVVFVHIEKQWRHGTYFLSWFYFLYDQEFQKCHNVWRFDPFMSFHSHHKIQIHPAQILLVCLWAISSLYSQSTRDVTRDHAQCTQWWVVWAQRDISFTPHRWRHCTTYRWVFNCSVGKNCNIDN